MRKEGNTRDAANGVSDVVKELSHGTDNVSKKIQEIRICKKELSRLTIV